MVAYCDAAVSGDADEQPSRSGIPFLDSEVSPATPCLTPGPGSFNPDQNTLTPDSLDEFITDGNGTAAGSKVNANSAGHRDRHRWTGPSIMSPASTTLTLDNSEPGAVAVVPEASTSTQIQTSVSASASTSEQGPASAIQVEEKVDNQILNFQGQVADTANTKALISAISPQDSNSNTGVGAIKPQPQPQPYPRTRSNGYHHDTITSINTSFSTLSFPLDESPIYTRSVLPNTEVAHPKPRGIPPADAPSSDPAKSVVTDPSIRSGAPVGNVAQLEATAERLSTGTSSIGDAIRDLQRSLKRSDSRRSAILAASVQAAQDELALNPLPAACPLKRHLSNASDIVSTNVAARYGGYSPAAFVKSPRSLPGGRVRSGSNRSTGRLDVDLEPGLTRHGPGKASVRSVRSTKLSLAEISESEPISLNQAALDAADTALPIDDMDPHDATSRPNDTAASVLSPRTTDAFHMMLDQGLSGQPMTDLGLQDPALLPPVPQEDITQRPPTSNSYTDAFVDFDGVHYEPSQVWELPQEPNPTQQQSRPGMGHTRRQSYLDPSTGEQILYYPVRIPAMLNLPPKLSNKPKVVQRDQHIQRRSQIISAVLDGGQQTESKRRSRPPVRESWLPDPLAGQRDSFMPSQSNGQPSPEDSSMPFQLDRPSGNRASYLPLPMDEQLHDGRQGETVMLVPSETHLDPELRRPQRLSRTNPDNRKSRLDKLSPHLRASAFFDPPPIAPQIEVQLDGTAMETLDKMLDASTKAPINAFTDHKYGAKAGPEVFGKTNKKHKSKLSTSSLQIPSAPTKEPKKRSSMMWFKRSSNHNSEEKTEDKSGDAKSIRSPSALGEVNGDKDVPETQGLASSDNGDNADDGASEANGEEDESDDEEYVGPPVTLLDELHMRKQQQKQRTQPITQVFPNGVHATLMELDAVAELDRKTRQHKRVNLAWEDPELHEDQNGSDDEDVPLAIIAAKHQGAKNLADLERPLGLLEKRELEDNEPLSRRRTRLLGNEPISKGGLLARQSMAPPKRQSVMTLSAHLTGHTRKLSEHSQLSPPLPEPTPDGFEDETLGERKRRLEAAELPRLDRPVSSSFSTELLSQFGDLDDKKLKDKKNQASTPKAEEETLGQRRARLQAERESREREMSYSNLVGGGVPQISLSQGPPLTNTINRRISMADLLSAHPKKEAETRAQLEKSRIEQEHIAAQVRDAKMAAMRMQMPATLEGPGNARAGGFLGGSYNDGRGGLSGMATQSTSALGAHHAHGRSQSTLSTYGMPMQQQGFSPYQASNMGPYTNSYARPNTMQVQMPLQMQLPVKGGSMDRVEQWRHGVMP